MPTLGQAGLEQRPARWTLHILTLILSPPGPEAGPGGREGGGQMKEGRPVPSACPLAAQLTHLPDAVLNLGPEGIFRAVLKSSAWEPHRWK